MSSRASWLLIVFICGTHFSPETFLIGWKGTRTYTTPSLNILILFICNHIFGCYFGMHTLAQCLHVCAPYFFPPFVIHRCLYEIVGWECERCHLGWKTLLECGRKQQPQHVAVTSIQDVNIETHVSHDFSIVFYVPTAFVDLSIQIAYLRCFLTNLKLFTFVLESTKSPCHNGANRSKGQL